MLPNFASKYNPIFNFTVPHIHDHFPLTISSIHYELPGKNDSVLPQDLILEKVQLIKNSREVLSTILKTLLVKLSFKSTDHFNY